LILSADADAEPKTPPRAAAATAQTIDLSSPPPPPPRREDDAGAAVVQRKDTTPLDLSNVAKPRAKGFYEAVMELENRQQETTTQTTIDNDHNNNKIDNADVSTDVDEPSPTNVVQNVDDDNNNVENPPPPPPVVPSRDEVCFNTHFSSHTIFSTPPFEKVRRLALFAAERRRAEALAASQATSKSTTTTANSTLTTQPSQTDESSPSVDIQLADTPRQQHVVNDVELDHLSSPLVTHKQFFLRDH
jgi:hypothetical protein